MKYLKLLRIKHYIKNTFVFVPLFFSMSFLNIQLVKESLLAFISFCFIASSIYIINDIKDIEKDRNHPKKKNRPIANGSVSIPKATVISITLFVLSITIGILTKKIGVCIMIASYFLLNIVYSYKLKAIPLFDVFVIAIGFLMRIYCGAFAIGVEVSEWLLLTTLSLSLFLGFGKRYGEKRRTENNDSRKVLESYNADTLKSYIRICMTLTIVFYSLYCAIGGGILGKYSVTTVPIVIFAMFRYYMILDFDDVDGDPTDTLLNDRIIIACVLLYALIVLFLMWR